MKKAWIVLLVLGLAVSAVDGVAPGEAAPGFSVKDVWGQTVKLSDYTGKIVVLEWFNPGCPFVRKHYDSGNMQALQKTYTGKGVIWLSVCSSAPGKSGHFPPAKQAQIMKDKKAAQTAILLDEDGTVGKQYGARATPHLFVIAADGTLAYQGAIDDKADTKKGSVVTARNYVRDVIDALLAGKAPPVTTTRSYGCSVKY